MLNAKIVWIAFVCYLIFLVAVAIIGKKLQHQKNNSAEEFATGGGTIRWPFLVMTYIASLMSTWVFFAGPGAYYRGGFGYWASELSYICMFPLIVHFVMNKVWMVNRQRHYTTPADLFYDRFKSPVLRVILALIFLGASFPYVTSVLVAISQAASIVTNGAINYNTILVIVGIVIVGYVMIGGMKSIATTDTIQGLVYIGILIAIVLVCLGIGFGGSLPEALGSVWEHTPDWFSYPGPDAWVPYSARLGYPLSCMIGWTIMLPHVFVRSGYSGASPKTQKKLMLMTPILQFVVWSCCMLIGLIAIAMLPDLSTADTEYIIPYLIQNIINSIHPILSTVLMVGFFIGAVAVGVTTADSFLLVSGTILTQDILVNTFRLKLSEKQKLTATRIVIAVIGAASIIMALNPPELIFTLIMFAIAIVTPLFSVLVIGLYWKRATKQAAIIASLAGTVIVLMTYFVWNIGGVWYGTFGLIASTICMIVISLFTKQDPADSEAFFAALGDGVMDYDED